MSDNSQTSDDSALNPQESPTNDTQVDATVIPENNDFNDSHVIKDLQEQLARSQADYANLVRRSREELGQIGQWTEDKTILKFLPILDNLERSLDHIPAELIDNAWIEGNRSIVRAMQKVISDFGVAPMNAVGQEVNPDLHDVISQIPHEGTNIQAEVEKGYMRGEKALRHAKVIVGDGTRGSDKG